MALGTLPRNFKSLVELLKWIHYTDMVIVMWIWILLTGLLLLLDRLWHKRKWDLLSKVPGPKPLPIIGNIKEIGIFDKALINPITRFFQNREGQTLIYSKEKMNILWLARQPIVFLSAPETVEPILSSSTAIEKGRFYKFIIPWLGDGLVMSTGDKWRRHRKMLTPTFHFRILDNFVSVMNEQASVLAGKIKEASLNSDWINAFDFYSKCTLDIICETAMGIRIQAQETDSTFTKMIHIASYQISIRSARPWLGPDIIYYNTTGGRQFKESLKYLHGITNKVITEKIKEKNNSSNEEDGENEFGTKKKLAFLDLLLESGLTPQETREQVDTFLFAGHDTTSTALSWMTYLLGLYPEVQEKLIEELDSVFGGDSERDVTQDDLKQLKYMDCVMKESQRVYPSVPGVSRTLDKDTEIGGFTIPEGTECFISIFSVHKNPFHHPDPEVFDPNRFSPENRAGKHPFSYIPFSAGARNCIGQKFALMEQKIIMCHVLRHFRILSLDQRDKLHLVPELVLRTARPIRTKFTPRS